MLKWAREQTPFLSTDMVELEKPKISSSNLSKWENGEDYPSITEAKALASLYRVPFACFYLLYTKCKSFSVIYLTIFYFF